MIKVTLKDGSVREFENELSVMDIAKSISEGLARAVVAASVNGKVVGLNHIVKEDCELNLFKLMMKKEKMYSDIHQLIY